MAQKSIKGNFNIAEQIKKRRIQLKMTIEEAAAKAGVGTKTWSRYEAGESIRIDKCKGICRALNWRFLPSNEDEVSGDEIEDFEKHEAWSEYLADLYGYMAAKSFAVGSDLLYDKVFQDLKELSSKPIHTHIGELNYSFMLDSLPPQFIMYYDYDFMYRLKSSIIDLRQRAKSNNPIMPHTVLEELIFYMFVDEARAYVELLNVEVEYKGWDDWVFDLFDDSYKIEALFSGEFINEEDYYHFSHWNELRFYNDCQGN